MNEDMETWSEFRCERAIGERFGNGPREISQCKSWYFVDRAPQYSLFFLISNSIHYSLPSTYSICYPLSSTFFRPHRPIIRRSKLYMQPVVLFPSADVFVVRPLRKYHWLHVQFKPPDDGPVRPETCRGKRITDIICRRKRKVYRVGNKEK